MSQQRDLRGAAEDLMRQHRLSAAIDTFQAHLQHEPDDLRALLEMGVCHLLNGAEDVFLSIYQRAAQAIGAVGDLPASLARLWKRYGRLAAKVAAAAVVIGSLSAPAYGQSSGHRYSGGVYVAPPSNLPGRTDPVEGASAEFLAYESPGDTDAFRGGPGTARVLYATHFVGAGSRPRLMVAGKVNAEAVPAGALEIDLTTSGRAYFEAPEVPLASATARTSIVWEVQSPALPVGTPVEIILEVDLGMGPEFHFDDPAGEAYAYYRHWCRLNVHRANGNGLDPNPSEEHSFHPATSSDPPEPDIQVVLSAVVGEELMIDFGLAADLRLYSFTGNSFDLRDLDIDIAATAEYTIARVVDPATQDPVAVTLGLVPEPASLTILALAGLPLLVRRRSRT